jgi:dTDP-4-amino-4,6-dideoxygalactose transaminase
VHTHSTRIWRLTEVPPLSSRTVNLPASAGAAAIALTGRCCWHTGLVTAWKILLSPPEVGPEERALLLDAFDSNWVAPAGPDIDAFEAELAALVGIRSVAALSSGTAALHLALMAVGVGAGDEVLVSTLTFGASAFAVTYLGARPCFVDCERGTWHLDPDLLGDELRSRSRAGRLPAAVIGVDLYGSVADWPRISEVCAEFDVPLIEDAAEAIGATRDGVAAGRAGRVAILSFNGNKMVTTGGGGAIISDDEKLVSMARHLATQARQPVPWYEHEEIGFNYRMGNLNAAVGRGQLRTLDERIAGRRRVRAGYERHLAAVPGVGFQQIPAGCEPNHWLTTVSIDPDAFGATPADVLERLRSAGIEARFGFKPMHLQPVFAGHPVVGGNVATRLFATSISLPSSSRLTDDDVGWISDVITSSRA